MGSPEGEYPIPVPSNGCLYIRVSNGSGGDGKETGTRERKDLYEYTVVLRSISKNIYYIYNQNRVFRGHLLSSPAT